MLVSMTPILREATRKGYGIVAPNIFDGYTVEVAFKVAYEMRAPMVLDSNGTMEHMEYIGEVTRFFCKRYPDLPVALNLDHGSDLENVMQAIRAGYSSVMIDKSSVPFEENVRETAEIVRIAHKVGVSVEAELGHVGFGRQYEVDGDSNLTMPEAVVEFVRRTDVDALAVAVGTAHGHYSGIPHIDFDRLDAIRKVSDIPLVLHGGSSTGDENLRKAIQHGVSKVNIGTDLGDAGIRSMKDYLSSYDPNKRGVIEYVYEAGAAGFGEKLKQYMELFGERDRW